MTELGSIFNPGEAEMTKQMASEKTLPAPSPVPAPPVTDADGIEVEIPDLSDLPLTSRGEALEPPRAKPNRPAR